MAGLVPDPLPPVGLVEVFVGFVEGLAVGFGLEVVVVFGLSLGEPLPVPSFGGMLLIPRRAGWTGS